MGADGSGSIACLETGRNGSGWGLDGWRAELALGRTEAAEAAGRPVAEDGDALDTVLVDGAEVAAVGAGGSVVADEEVLVLTEAVDASELVLWGFAVGVGLDEGGAVDVDFGADAEGFSGEADDAFEQRSTGGVADGDEGAGGFAAGAGAASEEEVVAGVEGGGHAVADDADSVVAGVESTDEGG